MSLDLQSGIALLVVGVILLLLRHWRTSGRQTKRAFGPRSRRPDESYQATNAIAKLLLDVLELRERSATWPVILKQLNPDDVPSLRTVLLELRWLYVDEPQRALLLIERVCIKAKRPGETYTRLELLEIAKSLAEKVSSAA